MVSIMISPGNFDGQTHICRIQPYVHQSSDSIGHLTLQAQVFRFYQERTDIVDYRPPLRLVFPQTTRSKSIEIVIQDERYHLRTLVDDCCFWSLQGQFTYVEKPTF